MKNLIYCDNCGDIILEGEGVSFPELPFPVDSALAGESATICEKCFLIKKNYEEYIDKATIAVNEAMQLGGQAEVKKTLRKCFDEIIKLHMEHH
jgi:hypothetical protein